MANVQPQRVIVTSTKSMGVAILLTILIGPLGLFYSTIFGGIIMSIIFLIISLIVGFLTLGFALIIIWPIIWIICIIWAALATSSYNKRLLSGQRRY